MADAALRADHSPRSTSAEPPAGAVSARTRQMLTAPLLPTLLRLATPNVIGLFAATVMIGYDGVILGRLGASALAGVALVFPLSMLMLQMSAGGLGGATTAAVARALGAGQRDEASRLAQHALVMAAAMGALFTLVLLGFGSSIYRAMGGRGTALGDALAYSGVLFGGAVVVWWTNVLAAIVRGIGGGLVMAITGGIGLAAAIEPAGWMALFTADPAIVDFGSAYLRIVGGFYGFFGLGLALFFASQGAGRMRWPLIASSSRLLVIAIGGWWCVHVLQTGAGGFFFVVATSLAVYGLTIAGAIALGRWKR